MIVFVQVIVVWFVVTTVIYLLVAIYSRSVRRERLEKEFDASFPTTSGPESGDVLADRDTYIAEGMHAYEKGLRRRLIGLIYVLPVVVFMAIVYGVNYR